MGAPFGGKIADFGLPAVNVRPAFQNKIHGQRVDQLLVINVGIITKGKRNVADAMGRMQIQRKPVFPDERTNFIGKFLLVRPRIVMHGHHPVQILVNIAHVPAVRFRIADRNQRHLPVF